MCKVPELFPFLEILVYPFVFEKVQNTSAVFMTPKCCFMVCLISCAIVEIDGTLITISDSSSLNCFCYPLFVFTEV